MNFNDILTKPTLITIDRLHWLFKNLKILNSDSSYIIFKTRH